MGRTSGHDRGPAAAEEGHGPAVLAVPTEYPAHLVGVAGRFGVRADRLLASSGLDPRALEEGGLAELPAPTYLALVERALALTGEPGLGFYYGLSIQLSSHGLLGLLAMASPTLGDALVAAERFMSLRAADLTLRLADIDAERVALVFSHAVPPHLSVFFTESFFVMLLQVGRVLLGRPLAAVCEFGYAEPTHFRRFAHLLPRGARFGVGEHRLTFSRALLEQAVVTSDEVMARRVERECQAALAALDRRLSLASKVRRDLCSARGVLPSLPQVAARRGVSERTLKRKLAEQGTSFRALVDALQRERAIELLRGTSLSVEAVAERLGYADKASFHRAFRRWFATTPAAFRTRDP